MNSLTSATRALRPLALRVSSRPMSTTIIRPSDEKPTTTPTAPSAPKPVKTPFGALNSFLPLHNPVAARPSTAIRRPQRTSLVQDLFQVSATSPNVPLVDGAEEKLVDKDVGENDSIEPFHFHVYSHKHNTHITVTRPNRKPIITMSCGNIGIRKSRRKMFDAAYQLTAYVLERLYHQGWQQKINRLEVVLKGFGQGREAATKVLLGSEGKQLADKIVRVSDDTKIKFGGCRSKNPRRI